MTFLDLARSRRSVRRFASTPVSREVLETCLEAARLAPSACNSQPFRFYVADEKATTRPLFDAALKGPLYRMNAWAQDAPVLVVGTALSSRFPARLGGWFQRLSFNLIDLAIAGEHLVLAATDQGLGSCWIGWFNAQATGKYLKLPRGERAAILFALGYPASGPTAPSRRKPLDEIRRYLLP